jgi:hypothetical protein
VPPFSELISENGGIIFLRNVGIYLQAHKAFLLRRPTPKIREDGTERELCKCLQGRDEFLERTYYGGPEFRTHIEKL